MAKSLKLQSFTKKYKKCSLATTSLAWISPDGTVYYLGNEEFHTEFAEDNQDYFLEPGRDWIGGSKNYTLMSMGWIKVSNFRDFAMQVSSVSKDAMEALAYLIVECIIEEGINPEMDLITYINVKDLRGNRFIEQKHSLSAWDVVEMFGDDFVGEYLLDGLERKSNPASSLRSIALAGLAGYLFAKK